jgi:hypothetical protein
MRSRCQSQIIALACGVAPVGECGDHRRVVEAVGERGEAHLDAALRAEAGEFRAEVSVGAHAAADEEGLRGNPRLGQSFMRAAKDVATRMLALFPMPVFLSSAFFARLVERGFAPIIVSSGAVGLGCVRLALRERPKSIAGKQAAAAGPLPGRRVCIGRATTSTAP